MTALTETPRATTAIVLVAAWVLAFALLRGGAWLAEWWEAEREARAERRYAAEMAALRRARERVAVPPSPRVLGACGRERAAEALARSVPFAAEHAVGECVGFDQDDVR